MSHLWRAIRKFWDSMKSYVFWSITNGNKVRFWADIWVGTNPLIELATREVAQEEFSLCVMDFVFNTGNWCWEHFVD